MSGQENNRYQFGDFELEPRERRLTAAGLPIALTPKVFDTLVLLIERAGHAVSKVELLSAIWPLGTGVDGHARQRTRRRGSRASSARRIGA